MTSLNLLQRSMFGVFPPIVVGLAKARWGI